MDTLGRTMHRYFIAAAAALLALIAASPAHAVDIERSNIDTAVTVGQAGQFFDREDNGRVALVGRKECRRLMDDQTPIRFSFQFSQTLGANQTNIQSIRVFAVDTDSGPDDFNCDFGSTDNCRNVANIDEFEIEQPSTNARDIVIDFDELVEQAVDGLQDKNNIELIPNASACETVQIDQQYFIRVLLEQQATGGVQRTEDITDAVLELDTKRPPPPEEVTSVAVTENNLFLSWTQEDTTDLDLNNIENRASFVAFYSTRDITGLSVDELQAASDVQQESISLDDPDADGPNFSGQAALTDIDTDDPGTRIFVAVSSRDDVENVSEPTFAESDTGEGFEVLPVVDFWEAYKQAGGAETGDCSTVPVGPAGAGMLTVALLGLGWARRHRR